MHRFLFLTILSVSTLFGLASLLLFEHPTPAYADPAPYFALEATEAQGDGANEFYVGRCFRVNIRLNTGGYNTNGADVQVNYDNSITQIVQSDCSTPATTVSSDGLFNTYPGEGNSISSSRLEISAYNNPGVSTNVSNGLFAHFYVLVLSASSSYDFTFNYTEDLTTDTNLAETDGDGTDILASVENLTLSLIEDTDTPYVDTQSPSNGETNVAVNSNVTFRLHDDMAGVDSSSAVVRMKQASGSYYTQSATIGSVQTTNANRYYRYSGTVNPDSSNIKTNSGYYEYATEYTVQVRVDDLGDATTHSVTSTWSFTTEDDTDAPYITNLNPSNGSTGVATSSNISFRVKDYKSNGGVIPGLGVDETSIGIELVGEVTATTTYTCSDATVTCDTSDPNNVLVTINPSNDFSENEIITLSIDASDQHNPSANVMSTQTYSFTTTDSGAPVLSNFSPAQYSTGNASSTNVGFTVSDGGAGVAIETLQVYLNGTLYTQSSEHISITGDASSYDISIDPTADFTEDRAVSVRISVRDQSPAENYISPNPTEYTFIVGLNNTTTTVEVPGECSEPTSCPACNCSGGGGGGVLIIREACPATVPTDQGYTPFAPLPSTTNDNIPFPDFGDVVVPDTAGSQEAVIIEREKIVEVPAICESGTDDLYVDVSPLIAARYGITDWQWGQIVANVNTLPTYAQLIEINDIQLPDNIYEFETIQVDADTVELIGIANVADALTMPVVIYPTRGPVQQAPLTGYTAVRADGAWITRLPAVLRPGEYQVTTFIQTEDRSEVQHIALASFVVPVPPAPELEVPEPIIQPILSAMGTSSGASQPQLLIVLILMAGLSGISFFATRLAATGGTFIGSVVLCVIAFWLTNQHVTLPETESGATRNESAIEETLREARRAYESVLSERSGTISSFSGIVADALSGRPIKGVTVGAGDQVTVTPESGFFLLNNIDTTESVRFVRAPGAKSLYLQTGVVDGETIELLTHLPLLATIESIAEPFKARKFKAVYPYASRATKALLSETAYTDLENQALFEILRTHAIVDAGFDPRVQLWQNWTSENLDETFETVLQVDYYYVLYDEIEGITKVKFPWYFIREDGDWKFVK